MFNLLRVLLLGALAWLVARMVGGILRASRSGPPHGGRVAGTGRKGSPRPAERLVRDPVCGVTLPEGRALAARVGGEQVHFCSERCRRLWEAGPAATR
jgi:YHS domain-containing protein